MDNIRTALNKAIKILKSKKIFEDSANTDAEVLLSLVLNKNKEFLYTYPEKKLTQSQGKKFLKLVWRRLRYKPTAYIVGKKEFYRRELFVNKNVLIPRPKTESMVEEVLNYCSGLRARNSELTIADIGTGSGCIAITLAKEIVKIPLTPTPLPQGERAIFPYSPSPLAGEGAPSVSRGAGEGEIKIYATDISSKAIHVAKKNAKKHRAKIQFFRGNLLEPIKNKKIDIIVANLPYLDEKIKNPYKKILNYEPKNSLYAKNGGLEYYKKLFQQIHEYKMRPQAIFCEAPPSQKSKLHRLAKKYLDVGFRRFL